MKKILSILCVVPLFFMAACTQTIPKEALQLRPEALELRQLQTRSFATKDEKQLLIAGAGILQDLGYNIDESETKLGVIVGSKDRDATEAGQVAGAILIAVLGGGSVPIDKNQKIKASLITFPAKGKATNLRITIQRIVWNTAGQVSKTQSIEDPEIYQDFFTKLSKSVFLDAHEI